MELVELLRSGYGNDNQAERFRMELRTCRRRMGEPLQTMFQDLKRLMVLAFPGQMGSMTKITAINAFVDSFSNRSLHKQVLQKGSAILSEALTWAIRIEAIDNSSTPDGPTTFERDGHHKEHSFAHAAAPEGVFDWPVPSDNFR